MREILKYFEQVNKIDSAVENTPARRLMLEVQLLYHLGGKRGISREMVNLRKFLLQTILTFCLINVDTQQKWVFQKVLQMLH